MRTRKEVNEWYGFSLGWRSLRAEQVRRARKEYACEGVQIDSDLIPTSDAVSPATGGAVFAGFAPGCIGKILPRELYVAVEIVGDDALESFETYRHTHRTCLSCALHLEVVVDRQLKELISTRRNGFPLSREWISARVVLGDRGSIPGFIVVRTTPEVCTAEVFQPRFERFGPNNELRCSGQFIITQKIVWPVGAENAYRYVSVDFEARFGSISFTSSELAETVDVSGFPHDDVRKIKSDFDPAIAARLLCPILNNVQRFDEATPAQFEEILSKHGPFKAVWDRLRLRDGCPFEDLGSSDSN